MINIPEYYNPQDLDTLENIFIDICQTESIEDIEYLLTSPNLKEHVDINTCNGVGLELAASFGNMDVVKFMLDSPKLQDHALIENNDYGAVTNAIKYSYLDITKYLLEHPSLKEVSYDDSMNILMTAADCDELEIFSYLFDFFEAYHGLKHGINNELYIEDIFHNLFVKNKLDIMESWVISKDIVKNNNMNNFLNQQKISNNNPQIEMKVQLVNNIFQKRDLNKSLNKELLSNSIENKKPKI